MLQFLLLFLTKFNKVLLGRNYWSIFYIPMLLCFFIPKSFTLSLTQYYVSLLSLSFCFIYIRTIFDCYVISILRLKTSFSSSCINLDILSILSFLKNITRFTWVSVPVIYHAYYIVDSFLIITQPFPYKRTSLWKTYGKYIITTNSTWIIFSIKQRCIYHMDAWCCVLNISKIMVCRRF